MNVVTILNVCNIHIIKIKLFFQDFKSLPGTMTGNYLWICNVRKAFSGKSFRVNITWDWIADDCIVHCIFHKSILASGNGLESRHDYHLGPMGCMGSVLNAMTQKQGHSCHIENIITVTSVMIQPLNIFDISSSKDSTVKWVCHFLDFSVVTH